MVNKKKSLKISAVFIIIIGLYYLYTYFLVNINFPFCLFYKLTNLYCPGCGVTRALTALLHFNFYQAFRYNELVVVLLPFLLIYGTISLKCYLCDKPNLLKIPNYIWWILVIISIIFGILRNLPPFDFLAPTIV